MNIEMWCHVMSQGGDYLYLNQSFVDTLSTVYCNATLYGTAASN